ncbi:5-formyltetrahydrofolate cyclo-ligase [Metamycoplasma auris 15026]|uniref:5-formyltetrahydrofolate cyclo-ligase n=1 Tax=Metamycoplasma auris 15026 TaxID=1188233 RepID=N9V0C8_9BACT|nr:5-formyltetrahydrofolate cyclo-ligase [Metamycoplasma auris]ENY68877.1 5-formyltetrahydrofolate cyclo-ligase [Metamycoplasma auris 15026]
MDKNEIRKIKLNERKNLNVDYFLESNWEITKKTIDFIKENNFKHIGIYLANQFEVQTTEIIEWCFLNKIFVYVPFVINKNEMKMVWINRDSKYILNRFKIKEPLNPIQTNLNQIECIFCPLVAFDLNLNRLGMGGGYYDFFFHANKENYLKIGLAFESQKLNEEIVFESHDIALDLIITEKNIYIKK